MSESIATLPPFGPIEGHMWFEQISSQWESQKNRFALIYFGKIQFLPPCIWNLPFMSYRLWSIWMWVFNCAANLQQGFDSGFGHNAFLLSSRIGKTYMPATHREKKWCEKGLWCKSWHGGGGWTQWDDSKESLGLFWYNPYTIRTLYEDDYL